MWIADNNWADADSNHIIRIYVDADADIANNSILIRIFTPS